jgi:hypothetical protein
MNYNNSFSPFLRLYKYRPKKNNTPKENFVTESLALLLFYNPDITKLFLNEFLDVTTEGEIKIDTQVSHNKDSIFDLTLTDTLNFHLLVECKMGAGIGKNSDESYDQLDKYIGHLKAFPINNKYLLLIDIGDLAIKEDLDITYKAARWNDIKVFLENQSGKTDIGELLRLSFIDLLKHLKVDRKLINGKLSWKCELCESEMIGQGIYSHQKKHERESQYKKLIDDENNLARTEFNKTISPHLEAMKDIKEKLKNIRKIEKPNYVDAKEITKLIEQHLPKSIWIYFINQIPNCFSKKAFSDYLNDIIKQLHSDKEKYIEEPHYLNTSYENIIKLVKEKKYC